MERNISLYELYKNEILNLLKSFSLKKQLDMIIMLDSTVTIIDFTCLVPKKYFDYVNKEEVTTLLIYDFKLCQKELEDYFCSTDFCIFVLDQFIYKRFNNFIDSISKDYLVSFLEFIQ